MAILRKSSRVLIVDDDQDLCTILDYSLRQVGYETRVTHNGTEALGLCARETPDILLLDLNLPDVNGFEICRALRADPTTRDILILMLTARSTQADRIFGLEQGADDYVTKPVSIRELVLRVDALDRTLQHRRPAPPPAAEKHVAAGEIALDAERFQVTVAGQTVPLTLLEFRLLHRLMEAEGRVMSRESLLKLVWDPTVNVEARTVDSHIKRLRDKLGHAGDAIETIRGVGYRLHTES